MSETPFSVCSYPNDEAIAAACGSLLRIRFLPAASDLLLSEHLLLTYSSTYTRPLTERMYFRSQSFHSRSRDTLVSVPTVTFCVLGRIVCIMSPEPHDCRMCWVNPIYNCVAVLSFQAPPIFPFAGAKLSPLAWFGTFQFSVQRVSVARHLIRVHAFLFGDAFPLRTGGFSWFFLRLARRWSAASRLPLGHLLPFRRIAPFSRLLQFEYRQLPSQHTCWFKFSTTSIRWFLVFVRQSKVFLTNRQIRRSVNSFTSFLHCCGKFCQISSLSNRQFEFVIN